MPLYHVSEPQHEVVVDPLMTFSAATAEKVTGLFALERVAAHRRPSVTGSECRNVRRNKPAQASRFPFLQCPEHGTSAETTRIQLERHCLAEVNNGATKRSFPLLLMD